MTGIHDLSFADYQKAPGVNNSMLSILANGSPAHLRAELDGLRPKSESRSQTFGSAFHLAVLEPEKAADAFYRRPDVYGPENKPWNGNAKECKTWIAEHQDKPIITGDERKDIEGMVASLQANEEFMRLFAGGKSEQSLFAVDAEGTQLKARLDHLKLTGNVILDLKSCQSARPEDFEKAVDEHGYYRQAAFYLDICNLLDIKKKVFVFAAVEKKAPYVSSLFTLEECVISAGRYLYRSELRKYRHCLQNNHWPAYTKGVQTIALPEYAMKRMSHIL